MDTTGGMKLEKIKAIETEYNGYRFRSRLEARWAVFFDAMNLDYLYEPEGFELPGGQYYLPDFWIPMPNHVKGPDSGYWVEIKPTEPEKMEDNLLYSKLSYATGHVVIMLIGQPRQNTKSFCRKYRNPHLKTSIELFDDLPFDMDVSIQNEEPCYMFYIGYPVGAGLSDQGKGFFVNDFITASKAASSARFEHGEKP